MNPSLRSILIAASALLLVTGAASAAQAERQAYVGGSVSAVLVKPDGLNDLDANCSASARPSLGGFAGVRLGALPIGNEGLPLYMEVGYQDIGRHTLPYKVSGGTTDLTTRGHSLYAAAKLDFWRPGHFSMYAKLGVARSSVTGSAPPNQAVIPVSGSRTGLLVGFGGQVNFENGLGVRAELTRFGKTSPHSSANGLGVGLSYAF